jgi:hypothetical protein
MVVVQPPMQVIQSSNPLGPLRVLRPVAVAMRVKQLK